MALRNIFNISSDGMDKQAFVQTLIPLARAALPHLGRVGLELGKTYALDRAIGYITNQVAQKGLNSVVSSLAGSGKDAADVKKLLSGVLSSDPNSPGMKKLFADGKTRGVLEGVLNGMEMGRSDQKRSGIGGIVDTLKGKGYESPTWKRESRPWQDPEGVRLARKI